MEVAENLVKATMGEMEKVLNVKTVVGEPVTIGEATFVPLISIGFGFGAGGGSGKGTGKQEGEGTGGGTGGCGGVKPVAIVIIDDTGIRIETLKGGLASAIQKLGETIPQVMEKCIETCMKKWQERGEGACCQ